MGELPCRSHNTNICKKDTFDGYRSFGRIPCLNVFGLKLAPQVYKVVSTNDTKAISTGMYCLTVPGFALLTAFGVMRTEWPIMLTNSACFFLSLLVLIKKLRS